MAITFKLTDEDRAWQKRQKLLTDADRAIGQAKLMAEVQALQGKIRDMEARNG